MPAQTQPARGMRDFLPADVRRREYVIRIIKEVYERYGFEPLETPAVENIETLMGKYGEEGNQLIFKILKRGAHEASGEADLALRYDLTVPLARVVAEHRDQLPKFFKRYQIQPVWRADRPARGRFREFYQCDIDAIGSTSMSVEAELCAASSEALIKLNFNDFMIRLNHRKLLTALLDWSGIPLEKHVDATIALDKLDKVGIEGVKGEFYDRNIKAEASQRLLDYLDYFRAYRNDLKRERAAELTNPGGFSNIEEALKAVESDPALLHLRSLNLALLDHLAENLMSTTAGERAISELRSLIRYAAAAGVERITIDPTLARGLSYYTGAIMEVTHPNLSGSLGGGGRYDNLIGVFAEAEIPACGFSLGLERILVVMAERGMFPPEVERESTTDCMVAIWAVDSVEDSLSLASELRASDLRVELYPQADKLKLQLKYASSRGVRFVAIIGPEERERGEVAIKDMQSGEQRRIPRNSVAAAVRKTLQR